MSNHSNNGGEMLHVAVITGLAAICGILLLVQLFRGQPMDLPSMLFIAVCFVIAVITAASLSQRTKG